MAKKTAEKGEPKDVAIMLSLAMELPCLVAC